jgi:hypothetical protein
MKCNTKISTETELISIADKLMHIVWMRYFIKCQSYDLDEYIVYQDNMSAFSLGRIAEYCPQSTPSTSRQNIS